MSARTFFLISVAFLLFASGFAVAFLQLPPYGLVVQMREQVEDWQRYPGHYLRTRPQKFLARDNKLPAVPSSGMLAQAWSGQTFMTGFFGERPGMRLIAMDGTVLHSWQVAFAATFADATHLEHPAKHPWDTHLHGAILYPDGDVVFNFEYGGLVRIDRCSRVKWRIARQTHHSVEADEEGNLWVPARSWRESASANYPDVPGPYWEESILKVSPQGKVLREISILATLFAAGEESVLFASGSHQLDMAIPVDRDFTHLNDVEVLSSRRAAAFAMFAPGDILISLRNLNLLMVVDPRSGSVKWSMTGPFLRQHDPDFAANGTILVFDNHRDSGGGRVRGGSRVLEIDPATRKVAALYGGSPEELFYTGRMGAQQRLPNGNLLITASEAGYAFEVTPARQRVWLYVNRWDDKSVAWIERATRYPQNYLKTPEGSSCS